MAESRYVSPIDRFQAIRGGRLANEAQQQQNASNKQADPVRQRILGLQEQSMQMQNQQAQGQMDKATQDQKIREAAATAYELIDLPDEQLMPALQQAMPEFVAMARKQGAGIDEVRKRLGGLVNGGIALGVIKQPEQPKAPASVQEFEYGQRNPEFAAYQTEQKKAGATKISNTVGSDGNQYGAPPKDHAWARNPDGSIALTDAGNGFQTPIALPIKGGPAEMEQKSAADKQVKEQGKARRMAMDKIFNGRRDLSQLAALKDRANWTTTGAVGSILGLVPFTEAGGMGKNIQSVKAKVGFETLQKMRENSPTGGALGSITERELDFLQSAIANLDQSQNEEQFKENVAEVMARYERTLALLESEYVPDSPFAKMSEAEITESINQKYPTYLQRKESDSAAKEAAIFSKYGVEP
jgi:hypothetical protein